MDAFSVYINHKFIFEYCRVLANDCRYSIMSRYR